MNQPNLTPIAMSQRSVHFAVRSEVDDSGNWWRGVLLVQFALPTEPRFPPGDDVVQHVIWTGQWRHSNPNQEDSFTAERAAITDATDRLNTRFEQIFHDHP